MPEGKRTLDTKTGIVYKSRNAAGKAVAHEFGLEPIPNYTFVWYDVVRLAEPNRFVDVEIGQPILCNGSIMKG